MKRFIAIIIVCCTLCMLVVPNNISALNVLDNSHNINVTVSERSAIIDLLGGVEIQKEAWGLSNINFSDIYIGNKVYMYELTNEGVNVITYMYPLIYDGEIIMAATALGNDKFQISLDFARMIAGSNVQNAAFVFDASGCYIYDGNKFNRTLVTDDIQDEVNNRITLDSFIEKSVSHKNTAIVSTSYIVDDMFSITNVDSCELLGYGTDAEALSRSYSGYYGVSIDYEGQANYQICWAAAVVMALSAFDINVGSSLEVACDWLGVNDLSGLTAAEQAQNVHQTKNALNHYLNGFATYSSYAYTVITDEAIARNLNGGYPVIGGFTRGSVGHMVTICGINVDRDWLYFYDPAYNNSSDGYKIIHRYTSGTEDQEIYGNYAYLGASGYWYYYQDTVCRWDEQ